MIELNTTNTGPFINALQALLDLYPNYNGTIAADVTRGKSTEPTKAKQSEATSSESMLQMICVAYFRDNYPDLLCYSSLNGVNLSGQTSKTKYAEILKLKREGMEPGVSDLYVALPEGKSLHIELKTLAKHSKQSPEQLAIECKLTSLGHTYIVCHSFQQFKQILQQHIKDN